MDFKTHAHTENFRTMMQNLIIVYVQNRICLNLNHHRLTNEVLAVKRAHTH